MTVKLFGQLQITVDGKRVKLSGRAVTLLTYLALEGRALHRTTAAQLLWPEAGPQGLRNLRVELTALRRQGIELCPNRASSLRLDALTELDDLQKRSSEGPGALVAALAQPLQTFNDHGNPVLAAWVQQQRQRLTQAVEQLSGAPARPQAEPAVAADQHLVQWLAQRVLPEFQSFVHDVRHPQLALYVGRPGSGRREALELVLAQLGLNQIEISAADRLNDLRSLLLIHLKAACQDGAPPNTHRMVPDPAAQTPDLAELVPLLLQAGPLALVVRHAERLSREAARLIDLLMGLNRPLLLVAITTPAGQVPLEELLGHHDQPGWFHVIHAPALTPESLPVGGLQLAPGTDRPDSDTRFEIIRQTEGFLGAIRCQLPVSSSLRGRLGQRLQRTLRAEVTTGLGSDLTHLERLALLPGPFSEAVARDTLGRAGLDPGGTTRLLQRALQAGILERVDSVLSVQMPGAHLRLPDAAPLLCFRSELQRAALAGSLDAGERHRLKRPGCPLPTVVHAAGPGVAVSALTVSPTLLEPHVSTPLPGGYVLLTRTGGWSLLRLGAADHAVPRLELHFAVPSGAQHWQLRLRLQCWTPLAPADPGLHVLSGVSATSREVTAAPWPQPLEPGRWIQARGSLQGQPLPFGLSVQATNLIAHFEHPEFC